MSENLKRAESLFNRIMNQSNSNNQTSNTHSKRNGNGGHENSSGNGRGGHFTHHNHSNNHHHHHPKSYKSHYKNYNSAMSSALPKRDPAKIAQETVNKVPADHHVLPYCWTIWHHSRSRSRKDENEETTEESVQANAAAVDSYLQTTNEIEFANVTEDGTTTTNIGSLEQLWNSLTSMKKTYEVPYGTELLMFKSGVHPVWEDPINMKGGRWVFRFNRRPSSQFSKDNIQQSRKRTALIWERLVLRTVSGSIIPDAAYSKDIQSALLSDICGLVLSVRKDDDIISVWNSNTNFSKKKEDSKKLTSFQARRIICDAILRVIREVDMIIQGSDSITALDSGSNNRVLGVSFDYRLHSENSQPPEKHVPRRHKTFLPPKQDQVPS